MAYKAQMPAYQATHSQGEDTELQMQVFETGAPIAVIAGLGHLYVYVFHGRNVFPSSHHERLTAALGYERDTLIDRADLLCKSLRECELTPPIAICDHLGNEVLTWNGETVERHEERHAGVRSEVVQKDPC
jgi:hypothetical protein